MRRSINEPENGQESSSPTASGYLAEAFETRVLFATMPMISRPAGRPRSGGYGLRILVAA